MVGVEDEREVTQEQMEWLKAGGRNRIERMARKFMKSWAKAGNKGDFDVRIELPSDILVVAKRKGAIGSSLWRFDYDKMKNAETLYEHIKEHNQDLETLMITNLKDHFPLEGNLTIMLNVSWHGHDAYRHGWEYCFSILPDKLFP